MAFRWIRRWVRRSSRPINQDLAHIWKRRLSLAYGILAWNALAVVGYAMYTGKRDWAQYHGLETDKSRPAVYFSQLMDIPKATVLKFDGLKKIEEFEIDNTKIFDNEKSPEWIAENKRLSEL